MLASNDPTNITLVIIWTIGCLASIGLAWYSYLRWRWYPNDSLSHRIAVKIQQLPKPAVAAIGLGIGLIIGMIVGMFAGHWFWPVELGRII